MAHSSTNDLISSYLLSFETGAPEQVAAHVADNFQNEHLGFLGAGCSGKAVYLERLKGFLSAFENLSYKIESIVSDEGQGAARYTMRFTQKGRDISVQGMMWFTFENGLIVKRTDCWDSLQYLKQTGASAAEISAMLEG